MTMRRTIPAYSSSTYYFYTFYLSFFCNEKKIHKEIEEEEKERIRFLGVSSAYTARSPCSFGANVKNEQHDVDDDVQLTTGALSCSSINSDTSV